MSSGEFLIRNWFSILLQGCMWAVYILGEDKFFLGLATLHLISLVLNSSINKLDKRIKELEKRK